MMTTAPVLGVLGLCWVYLSNPTHLQATDFKAPSTPVLGVLGLRACARVRAIFSVESQSQRNSHARLKKPNTPNTLNTPASNAVNLKTFPCVGFVLGCSLMCWVQDLGGVR